MQTTLVRKCTVGKNKGVPAARKAELRARIIAALNDGTITLRRYTFRRVGFNRALYERLLGVTSNTAGPRVEAGGRAERVESDDQSGSENEED